MPSSQSKDCNPQDIVYIVEDIISDTAKETAMDKVQKLILRDAEDFFTAVLEYGVPLEDCRKGGHHGQTITNCRGER